MPCPTTNRTQYSAWRSITKRFASKKIQTLQNWWMSSLKMQVRIMAILFCKRLNQLEPRLMQISSSYGNQPWVALAYINFMVICICIDEMEQIKLKWVCVSRYHRFNTIFVTTYKILFQNPNYYTL